MEAQIKERPYTAKQHEVRAMLAGTKKQLRILAPVFEGKDLDKLLARHPNQKGCPLGEVGQRLWVRETWQDYCPMWEGAWCGCGSKQMQAERHQPVYRADDESKQKRGPAGEEQLPNRWRSAVQMPRWASRLLLEITAVRVERVQDISEADALAEGIERDVWDQAPVCRNYLEEPDGGLSGWFQAWRDYSADGKSDSSYVPVERIAAESYCTLWQKINGPESWAANPFVWVVTFRVIESK